MHAAAGCRTAAGVARCQQATGQPALPCGRCRRAAPPAGAPSQARAPLACARGPASAYSWTSTTRLVCSMTSKILIRLGWFMERMTSTSRLPGGAARAARVRRA